MTRIIFLKDGTFFCFTRNCLKEGSSAGKWEIKSDTLKLNSSLKIFNKLKEYRDFIHISNEFIELKNLKFAIKADELLSIK